MERLDCQAAAPAISSQSAESADETCSLP
jgi:hypothetical protein